MRLATRTDDWQARDAPPRTIHGILAMALALAITAFLLTGALIKQDWPASIEPEQISAPEASQ